MPNIITQGAGSAQGFGFAARADAAVYVEDVFSTYAYIGNGGTQTITNNIDLSTKGGLVWIKNFTNNSTGHAWTDTVRGAGTGTTNSATNITSSSSSAIYGNLPSTGNDYLSAFTTTGFTVVASNGANASTRVTNRASDEYVSWTFRKQAKFFDIVTYTGNGTSQTINHSLGSVPGCIMIKQLSSPARNWAVYHRSLGNTTVVGLNLSTAATTGATTYWNSTSPTSSNFTIGSSLDVNASGLSYVAYVFAHDAGGFGASGADNVISFGSYTGTGVSGNTITLGYEPQFVIFRRTDAAGSWYTFDCIRPFSLTQSAYLIANTTAANALAAPPGITPTPTGFVLPTTSSVYNFSGANYIYMAIRRGPMRAPTSASTVFSPNAVTVSTSPTTVTTGFPVDMSLTAARSVSSDRYLSDRMRGASFSEGRWQLTNATTSEGASSTIGQNYASSTGIFDQIWTDYVIMSGNVVFWNFRRAPGFFDISSYTGTGSTRTVNHNLTVAPELMIIKRRNGVTNWAVYAAGIGSFTLALNNANGKQADFNAYFANTNPTSSVFTVGTDADTNASSGTYIAYLFASVAGVSKVGTYTGNGSSQTINCGFTAGSRFVMIKRYDSTGNWTIFDSARGIVAGNDPALYSNSNVAEVTTVDAVDTDNSGFVVNQDATLNLNVNAASYVYLAIA